MSNNRSSISPLIFTSPSIKLKLKVIALVVIFSLVVGVIVHIFDSIHYNNIINQAYTSNTINQFKFNQTVKDYKFVLNQDINSLNCYQLQTNLDQNLCNAHNTNLP